MTRILLFAALAFLVLAVPLASAEPPTDLDDAKSSLARLAAWFESLPPDERADAARELRRWLDATYGGDVPFPFQLPSEGQIAAWESTEPQPTEPEPAASEPALPAAPADSPAPPEPQAVPRTPRETALSTTPSATLRCNTLTLFDTDRDGALNALDRHWRHVYLWFDADRDGRPAEGEMVAPYERKIREIGLELRHFVRGKGKKASRGEIESGEYVLLDTDGNGFSATRSPLRDDAALAVDTGALRRDPQGLDIRDAAGAEATGIQPFVAGWRITDSGGTAIEVDCPG